MPRRRGPAERARLWIDWGLRSRTTGRIVIGQWPNLPLWLFGLASGLGWLVTVAGPGGSGEWVAGLRIAAALALGWWALDELLRGVNPWRRTLGGGVLAFVLWRAVYGS